MSSAFARSGMLNVMRTDEAWGAEMVAFPRETPESKTREAMKFVRVALVNGHLTDISIAMILVELRRSGVVLSCR